MNMQDPSPAFPEHLKCPRCESSNTKFCYYNNYNLSQPRHFCKACRRYWTKGGTLRNVPVGGGCRKAPKRPSNPKRPNPGPDPTRDHKIQRAEPSGSPPQDPGSNPGVGVAARSFSELMATSDGFGSLLDGFNPDGPFQKTAQLGGFTAEGLESGLGLDPVRDEQGNEVIESYLLPTGFGWPDLDVYTHG